MRGLLAWIALLLLSLPLTAGVTASSLGNFANFNSAHVAVNGNPPNKVTEGLQDALAAWNSSACNEGGDDFPQINLGVSSLGGTITLNWRDGITGPHPQGNQNLATVCATIRTDIDGSTAEITLYDRMQRPGETITFPCFNSRGIAADSIAHELGHYLGLGEAACPTSPSGGLYIMGGRTGEVRNGIMIWDTSRAVQAQECTAADSNNVPPGEPEAEGGLEGGGGLGGGSGDAGIDPSTPIVLDLGRPNFWFVAPWDGVWFDIDGDGGLERTAWTDPSRGDAFLALDRNWNGLIDSGRELFGAVTAQIPAMDPNGFHALALLDRPVYGGNLDGWLSPADPMFWELVVWTDSNQDGISQIAEIESLTAVGIEGIQIEHRTIGRRDRHGNLLRWVSWVLMQDGSAVRAVDVSFETE